VVVFALLCGLLVAGVAAARQGQEEAEAQDDLPAPSTSSRAAR